MDKNKNELKKQLFYLIVVLVIVIIIAILLNIDNGKNKFNYNNSLNKNIVTNIEIKDDNILRKNLDGLIEEETKEVEIDYKNINRTELGTGESIIIGNEILD